MPPPPAAEGEVHAGLEQGSTPMSAHAEEAEKI